AVRFGQDHRAARVADELVGALDHAMALAGRSRKHLSRRRDLEPLLGGRFGLHLGHFASFREAQERADFLLRADQSPKSIKDRHGMPCRAAFPGTRPYYCKAATRATAGSPRQDVLTAGGKAPAARPTSALRRWIRRTAWQPGTPARRAAC